MQNQSRLGEGKQGFLPSKTARFDNKPAIELENACKESCHDSQSDACCGCSAYEAFAHLHKSDTF